MLNPMNKKEMNKFNDFIIKVKRVFSKDIFIIQNRWIIGGCMSNASLPGDFVLEISPDYFPYVENVFELGKEKPNVYIPDISIIKKDTTDFDEVVYRDISEQEYEEFVSVRLEQFFEILRSDENWYPLNLTEEAIETCFDKSLLIKIPDPKNEIHDVIIGKSMMPGITKKDLENIIYRMEKFSEINDDIVYEFVLQYDFTHYRMFGQYFFL